MRLAIAAITSAAVLLLAGCGDTAHHDAPNPAHSTDIVPAWHRVQTPPSFQTIMYTCLGRDGLYLTQSAYSVTVVPDDPACTR